MFFLLAALACETAPQNGASASSQTIDPSRDIAQASMSPMGSALLDPLLAGITFGAVDPSEITVEFGQASSGALAEEGLDEAMELDSRWDSAQAVDTSARTHKKSAPPKVKKVSTSTASVGSGPDVSIDAKEVEAAPAKPMSVSQVVRKQRGKVQYCHDTGKTRDSQISGRVTVAWTVSEGKATNIQVMDNTTGDELMASCVARQVRSFRFPKDLQEDVSYPFVFQQG